MAHALLTNEFCRLRVPRQLHSDHSRNFTLNKMSERQVINRVQKTPPHPQSNGMVERHVTVEKPMQKIVST